MEVSGAVLGSEKRPDILVYNGVGESSLFIDWITCAVSAVAGPAAVTPGHAADVGVAKKNGAWLELVERQGDHFLGCAAEDGGRLSDELVDVIDEACASIGGSRGEQQAVATSLLAPAARGSERARRCEGDQGEDSVLHRRPLSPSAPPLRPPPGRSAPPTAPATLPRTHEHVLALQCPSTCRRARAGDAPPFYHEPQRESSGWSHE